MLAEQGQRLSQVILCPSFSFTEQEKDAPLESTQLNSYIIYR